VEELVDIVATCCILHNMLIADRQSFGDDKAVVTRNIISFDYSAPQSDMVVFSPAVTREEQAMHWRETADLVENKAQHLSLKNAIATHLWSLYGSSGEI
jgi:hypothetical protein